MTIATKSQKRRFLLIILVSILLLVAVVLYFYGRSLWVPVYQRIVGKESIESVIQKYGAAAEQRLRPAFTAAGVSYPPAAIRLLAIKDEKVLELWAKDAGRGKADGPGATSPDVKTGGFKKIKTYKVRAASGVAGPKLREGDEQVPEGFYKIIALNPNSSYHLSMMLNYPNEFDLKHAKREGRTQPGTNIFIHGKAVSIGCLAMGDPVIEELFTLAHRTGIDNIQVMIAPWDPRKRKLSVNEKSPAWLSGLYQSLNEKFSRFKSN